MSVIRRPILKPVGKDRFELVEPYEWRNVHIPRGFRTNGADIPRVFWSLYPPNSPEYLSAVVIHDYLCEKATCKRDFLRADLALRRAMLDLGVRRSKAWVFFVACRLYHLWKYADIEWDKDDEFVAKF